MDPIAAFANLDGATELSHANFQRLAEFITSELGIKMPDSKLTMVNSRLLRRVRDLHLESLEHYCHYLFAGGSAEERDHFINAITTNKTDFFREPEHFAYLTHTALPALRRAAGPGRCWRTRVWSAGCSSGEEPYTLAMLLNEYAQQNHGFDFAILATDVSTRVLEQARLGIYHETQISPVPHDFRVKHILRSKKRGETLVRVAPRLRQKVSFHRLNFMATQYPIAEIFDVIFFRNVLIYFDKPTQEMVINRICRHLAPGGYLFVGHSESLAGLEIPVTSVQASIFRMPEAERFPGGRL